MPSPLKMGAYKLLIISQKTDEKTSCDTILKELLFNNLSRKLHCFAKLNPGGDKRKSLKKP